MNISNIDKQIIETVDFMNDKEMKPFASCDGVLEEHENELKNMYGDNYEIFLRDKAEMMLFGYIDFMDNDYTKELLANALDNDLMIEFKTAKMPYEIYGNVITGQTYGIRFMNLNGERTDLVNKVVKETYEKKMIPSEENLQWVSTVIKAIPNEPTKEFVDIIVNTNMNFNMKNDDYGKHLTIYISHQKGTKINPSEFAEFFNKEFGLISYTNEDESNNVIPSRSYTYLRKNIDSQFIVILRDEYIERIPEMLKKMFEHEFTILIKK